MKTAAVVLAAGLSRRAGQPKLLLRRDGMALLQHALQPLLQLPLDRIVVVVSAASQAQSLLESQPLLQVAINPQPERGLSSSLQCGAALLRASVDALLVVLADMPRVSIDTYHALLAALRPGDLAAVPVYHGRRGNPVLLSSRAFAHIETLSGDHGLRQVLQAERDAVRQVAVPDPGITLDLDEAEALRQWQNDEFA